MGDSARFLPGRITTTLGAFLYASVAHEGQTDKSGKLYIDHLRRVASNVRDFGDDYVIVAWLHDVLEDHPDLHKDLQRRVSPEVFAALRLLARDKKTSYKDYIGPLIESGNDVALAVKLADLMDHLRFGAWNVLSQSMVSRYVGSIQRIFDAKFEETVDD